MMIIGKICKADLPEMSKNISLELLETITNCKLVVNEVVEYLDRCE